jgi:carboxyl-terminal processing protease
MNRTFVMKATVLAGALLTAFILTIYRPSPQGLIPFGVGQAEVRAAPGTPASKTKTNYDITALKIFNQTVVKIRDNYVDPAKIDARTMLISALDYVQRNIAEVLVDVRDDKTAVIVTVNDKTQTFNITDVDSLWRLASKLKEVFRFIQTNMNPGSDAAQIEYAAVNGMLSTLDPHSILLDPEGAREMDVQTSGKFGGIGIVIGMRKDKKDGQNKLTVMSLIPGETPASRAGLKAGDRIVKINDEATINLTINEAMSRLRGDPQTKVVVTIERTGVAATAPYDIIRDVIHVTSVHPHLLSGGVGYFKIDQFNQDVAADLKRGMEELRKQGARAWVLDLRNNPGGLLEQAVRVADLFLDNGTIVTTVGHAGKQREEKRAQAAGTDRAPLAVLVNGGSASASEIVAGALKNLDRAVIVGQATFGKGSVQVLFDQEDGSKLKLTIAQYLTPGDVSIQSVGIGPDIELDRVLVPEKVTADKALRLLKPPHPYREADLDAHIVSKYARELDKPSDVVRFIEPNNKKKRPGDIVTEPDSDNPNGDPSAGDDDDDPTQTPDTDRFVEDFNITFARDLVASGQSARRKDLLRETRGLVQKRKAEEEARVAAALGKLGIDWSQAQAQAQGKPGAKLTAVVTTDRPGNKVLAGDTIAITGSVTNSGAAPAYQVHGVAGNDWAFEGTELVFGKIDPGQTRTFTAYVKVPKATDSRVDELSWSFLTADGSHVDVAPTKITMEGLPRPQFAYAYQLIDDGPKDNGDGLVQLGESLRLRVQVKNSGKGAGLNSTATLRSASGDMVVVNKGRFELQKFPSGDTRTFDFTFDLKKEFADKEVVLELSVYDQDLPEGVNEKLHFPVHPAVAGPTEAHGTVRLNRNVDVHEGASEESAVIGTAKKGANLTETGKAAAWVRVWVENGRPAFVPASAVTASSGPPTAGAFTSVWQVTPPALALQVSSLETTGDHWHLQGTATDDTHVEDVYVLVSNREAKIDNKKVFYLSNRGKRSDKKLDFSSNVPVWPGNNRIIVVARENNEVKAIQSVYILRNDKRVPTASVNQLKNATP